MSPDRKSRRTGAAVAGIAGAVTLAALLPTECGPVLAPRHADASPTPLVEPKPASSVIATVVFEKPTATITPTDIPVTTAPVETAIPRSNEQIIQEAIAKSGIKPSQKEKKLWVGRGYQATGHPIDDANDYLDYTADGMTKSEVPEMREDGKYLYGLVEQGKLLIIHDAREHEDFVHVAVGINGDLALILAPSQPKNGDDSQMLIAQLTEYATVLRETEAFIAQKPADMSITTYMKGYHEYRQTHLASIAMRIAARKASVYLQEAALLGTP